MFGMALTLNATPTPTPTSTPKRSFFSPRVNPSATPARIHAAVGRGAHLGVDRSSPTPIPKPKPSATAKKKAASPEPRKSPTVTPTVGKAATSPTAIPTPSPQKEKSPEATPSPTPSAATATASPSSTPTPMPTSTPAPTQSPSPTPTATATPRPTPTPTVTPTVSPPTKIELILTKFEPQHGSPGEPNYRSAQLSYRINVPRRMEYPTINFTVEASAGKLFERVSRLPAGSAYVEPGDDTEHTVALDPAPRDDWADAYAKTDRAKFNWSIEGESSGGIEKPVKNPWP
jgi:hypothetical protein